MATDEKGTVHFTVPGLSNRLRRGVERYFPLANYPADWPSTEAVFASNIRMAADEIDRMAALLSASSEAAALNKEVE